MASLVDMMGQQYVLFCLSLGCRRIWVIKVDEGLFMRGVGSSVLSCLLDARDLALDIQLNLRATHSKSICKPAPLFLES